MNPIVMSSLRFEPEERSVCLARLAADALPLGIIVCDAGMRVRWMNAAAAPRYGNRSLLATEADRIVIRDPAEARRVGKLLREVSSKGTVLFTLVRGGATAVELCALGMNDGLVLIFTERGRVPSFERGVLRMLYGLTPAEERLAVQLTRSPTLVHAVRVLGANINTAKRQMKRVFEKVGVRRQSELVRVLVGGVAPLNVFLEQSSKDLNG